MKLKRVVVRGVQLLLLIAFGAVAVAVTWYSVLRWNVARSIAIDADTGIDTLEAPVINGVRQWVQIRGQDRKNPVLLLIHAGPGTPMMPFAHDYQPLWESEFTVAQWDQRMSGKTRRIEESWQAVPDGKMIDTLVRDAYEVARYVARQTGKQRIVIVAHSFGSVIGLKLVKQHPELFYAYAGIGQFFDVPAQEAAAYAFSLTEARKRADAAAMAELESIAPYPASAIEAKTVDEQRRRFLTNMKWLMAYHGDYLGGMPQDRNRNLLLMSPPYNALDAYAMLKPKRSALSQGTLLRERLNAQLSGDDLLLKIPVVFFHGRHDREADAGLIELFFSQVQAPYKRLVWLDQSAHFPMKEEPQRFRELLAREIRPLTVPDEMASNGSNIGDTDALSVK